MNSFKRRNRFMLLLMLHMFFVAQVLGAVLESTDVPIGAYYVQTFGFLLFFAPPVIIYFVLYGKTVKTDFYLAPLGLVNAVLVVIITFAFIPFFFLLSYVSSLIFTNEAQLMVESMRHTPAWALFLTLAVAPAVFEEIVFRGVLFGKQEQVSLRGKIIMSALFFAVMHIDPQQFIYTFFAGLIFAALMLITRSIKAPIIAHFSINAFNLWALLNVSETGAEQSGAETLTAILFLMLLTLPVLLFAVYLLFMNNKRKLTIAVIASRLIRDAAFLAALERSEPENETDKDGFSDDKDAPQYHEQGGVQAFITWELWGVFALYFFQVAAYFYN